MWLISCMNTYIHTILKRGTSNWLNVLTIDYKHLHIQPQYYLGFHSAESSGKVKITNKGGRVRKSSLSMGGLFYTNHFHPRSFSQCHPRGPGIKVPKINAATMVPASLLLMLQHLWCPIKVPDLTVQECLFCCSQMSSKGSCHMQPGPKDPVRATPVNAVLKIPARAFQARATVQDSTVPELLSQPSWSQRFLLKPLWSKKTCCIRSVPSFPVTGMINP